MDDSSWEDLDVDDSDLPSLIHPSKTLLPCKRPQQEINNKSSSSSHQTIPSFSLEPCSQNPRFRPSSPSQPEYINPETLVSQSQQTLHHAQFEKEEEGPSTSGRHLIPGPAGKMQAAMNRKVLYNRNNEEQITTQECLRRIQEVEDKDFKSNPWLCAMEFHGNEGGSKGFSGLDGNGAPRYPLKTIKTLRNDRVPRVVAIIDSCTPNGFGDLSVTLKDPTGTIGANIHRKVITESEFGKDILVGSVLILQQVVVFSPSLSTRYLNITLRNIFKVISKNSGPPTKTYHAFTDRLAPYSTGSSYVPFPNLFLPYRMRHLYPNSRIEVGLPEERREVRPQPPMVEKSSFLRSREAEVVTINAIREKGKKSVDYDIQMKESRPARENFHFSSSNNRYRNASEVESLLMRNKKTDGTRMEAVRRDSCNADLTIIDDNNDHSKEASQSKTISHISSSAAIEVEEDHRQETGRAKSEAQKPKQQLVSTTSLREWTNKQLEELFADGW